MDSEKVSKRGGVRPGAGRPKGSKKMTPSDARPQHQLRANPDEWKLIQAFARMVKHGQRDICEEFLKSHERL